jgi:hypothetical protein
MGKISKTSLFIIVILAVSYLIAINPADAQTIPKPSTPEFTVRYVNRSYFVSATHDIDIYTGKNVTTHEAYYVQRKTIELTIKNQAFTAFKDSDNHSINLYYSVRMKGYFGGSWNYPNIGDYYVEGKPEVNYVRANTSSDSTVIAYGLVGNNGTVGYYCFDISAGGQADFQVQAFIGYNTRTTFMGILGESHQDVFTGETSGWSGTQTLTIPDDNSSSTPSSSPTFAASNPPKPTTSPQQPDNQEGILSGASWEQIAIILLSIMVILLSFALALSHRRSAEQTKHHEHLVPK